MNNFLIKITSSKDFKDILTQCGNIGVNISPDVFILYESKEIGALHPVYLTFIYKKGIIEAVSYEKQDKKIHTLNYNKDYILRISSGKVEYINFESLINSVDIEIVSH